MEYWRKKGDKYNQELARTKSSNHYRKTHFGVPFWEKQFVASAGLLSWKKFLEARKFTHLYNSVLEWDDSAGEEAFRASKEKFYANFHGLPCDIELDNPDLYIDQIDWNSETDKNLILELESDPPHTDNSKHDPVIIFGDVLPDPYTNYSHGWGELDEKANNDGINWAWDIAYNWWDSKGNDKKEEDQGWSDDYRRWNKTYYEDGNNQSHKMLKCHGDNSHRNRSWRNRKKPTAQAHGSQWIQVHPCG